MGCTGLSLLPIAKQEKRCSTFCGAQAEAPAGGEIEGFRIAPDIGDDAGDGAAGEGFFGDPEQIAHICGADDDELVGIKAKGQKPRSIRQPEKLPITCKLQIENRHALGCQQRPGLSQRKAKAGAAIAHCVGENLLQEPPGQVWKGAILGFESAFARLRQCRLALDIGNGVPQRGKALLAIGG